MRRLLLIILIVLISFDAYCADYYFSSSTGSDAGSGSISEPWQTLTKLNSTTYSAGDNIYLQSGDTWTIGSGEAGIDIDFDCTEGSPCTISSYGAGAKPIIDASAQTGDGRGSGEATETPVYVYTGGNYVTVDGLDLRGPVDEYTVNGYGAGFTHFTLQNCSITGSGYASESPVRLDGDYVYILNNYVYGNGNAFRDGIQISGATDNAYVDYNIIRGNEIVDLAGIGGGARMVHCDHGLIEDNYIHGVPTSESYHWGIVFRDPLDADVSNVIRNNVVDLQASTLTGSTDARGFSTWNSTGDADAYIKVLNNTFIGNGYGAGMRFENCGAGRAIAQNNITYDFANMVNVSSSVAAGGVVFSNFCTYSSGAVTGDAADYVDNGDHQTGDPLLVDVATPTALSDYAIQAGSPCINAGASGDADLPTDDIIGTARATIDIGAYEYAAGPVYDAPIIEILTEPQSTTAETITITGTLTTDSALTGSGVDVNGVTATADDGTFDEAVEAWTALGVTLSLGSNTITATGTDSDSETDTDTVSITRTVPVKTSKINGTGVIHNATIH